MAVSVDLLVMTGEATEVGGSRVTGHSPFLEVTDGRSVVRGVGEGGVMDIMRVGQVMFKGTVGDSALGVVG